MHASLHEGDADRFKPLALAVRRMAGASLLRRTCLVTACLVIVCLVIACLAPAPVLAEARQGPATVAYRSHAECVDAARASKRAMSDDREAALARRAFLDEGYDGEVFYISMGFDHRRGVMRLERTRAIWLCAGPVLRQTIHVSDWR